MEMNKTIGVISDSHDNLEAIRRAVKFFNDSECGLIIHAGDIIAPFAARELAMLHAPVRAVFGNCDGEKTGLARTFAAFGEIREPPFSFSYEGIAVTVSHLEPMINHLENTGAVFIYGHTHKPKIEKSGHILIVNPGECCGWLTGKNTVAIIDPKLLAAEIIYL